MYIHRCDMCVNIPIHVYIYIYIYGPPGIAALRQKKYLAKLLLLRSPLFHNMWEYLDSDIYTKKFDAYFKMWLFIELRQLLLRVFIYVDLSKRTFWKTLEQTFPQIPSWGSRATCDWLFFGWHGYESLVKVNTSPPIGCWKHQHNIMYYIHSSQCVVVAMAILPNMLQNMLLNMGTGHCIHIIFRQCFFFKKNFTEFKFLTFATGYPCTFKGHHILHSRQGPRLHGDLYWTPVRIQNQTKAHKSAAWSERGHRWQPLKTVSGQGGWWERVMEQVYTDWCISVLFVNLCIRGCWYKNTACTLILHICPHETTHLFLLPSKNTIRHRRYQIDP